MVLFGGDKYRNIEHTTINLNRESYSSRVKKSGCPVWLWLLLLLLLLILLLILVIVLLLVLVPKATEKGTCNPCVLYGLNVRLFSGGFTQLKSKLDYLNQLSIDYLVLDQDLCEEKHPLDFQRLTVSNKSDVQDFLKHAEKQGIKVLMRLDMTYTTIYKKHDQNNLTKYSEYEFQSNQCFKGDYNIDKPYKKCSDPTQEYSREWINCSIYQSCFHPIINLENMEALEVYRSIIMYYLEMGVGGFYLPDLGLANVPGTQVVGLVRNVMGATSGYILADEGGTGNSKDPDVTSYLQNGADLYVTSDIMPVVGFHQILYDNGEMKKNIQNSFNLQNQVVKDGTGRIALKHSTPIIRHVPKIMKDLREALHLVTYWLPGTPFLRSGDELTWGNEGGPLEPINWNAVEKSKGKDNILMIVEKLGKLRKDGTIKDTFPVAWLDVEEKVFAFTITDSAHERVFNIVVNFSEDSTGVINVCPNVKNPIAAELVMSTSSFIQHGDKVCEFTLKSGQGVVINIDT